MDRTRFLWVFILQRTQLSTFSFPRSAWISVACPPGSTTEIHFGSPGSRNLNSQLLLARLFQSAFTQSTRSVDACPPTDRRSPTTSSLQEVRRLSTNMSHHCMPFNLWGHASTVWSNPLFTPILLMLTHNPLVKPWFGLRDRLGKLSPMQLGSPQCLMSIDLSLQWDLTVVTLTLASFSSDDPCSPVLRSNDPRSLLILQWRSLPNSKGMVTILRTPYNGSLTIYLLRRFCNAIPPEIFNFTVRIRSRPRDSDQQTRPIPARCFNQKL
jgi:hypothetical protein